MMSFSSWLYKPARETLAREKVALEFHISEPPTLFKCSMKTVDRCASRLLVRQMDTNLGHALGGY
jgi:hypothetical protein